MHVDIAMLGAIVSSAIAVAARRLRPPDEPLIVALSTDLTTLALVVALAVVLASRRICVDPELRDEHKGALALLWRVGSLTLALCIGLGVGWASSLGAQRLYQWIAS